ncbi:hypothetical protein [Paraliomyxa miuraensis]|uniref:hypothetical protein n=1 Tax=Paraliomyxa miuraensis TaxID=376150 RepID=UPI00225A5745|nr:hypothetical protein [Paraliomyxa miuraensis]MCX4246482.1 hypothetical protein [Paraliomyxa miuraensis]
MKTLLEAVPAITSGFEIIAVMALGSVIVGARDPVGVAPEGADLPIVEIGSQL